MARPFPKFEPTAKKAGEHVLVPNYSWQRGQDTRKLERLR